MALIKPLESSTSNSVTATSVIPTIASAIEIVLRNAAEAGASQITLYCDSPYTSFIVSDNGRGFALNALLRIGSSQNTTDSYAQIGGKSLFWLGLLSKLSIRSRSSLSGLSKSKRVSFGVKESIEGIQWEETSSSTIIQVEEIFKRFPVRWQHCKLNCAAQVRLITQTATLFAACHPFTEFTLRIGSTLTHLAPKNRLLDRLAELFPDFASPALRWIPICLTSPHFTAKGILLSPSSLDSTSKGSSNARKLLFYRKTPISFPEASATIDAIWAQYASHNRAHSKPLPVYFLEIDGHVEAFRSLDHSALVVRSLDPLSLQNVLQDYFHQLLSETLPVNVDITVKSPLSFQVDAPLHHPVSMASTPYIQVKDESENGLEALRTVSEAWSTRNSQRIFGKVQNFYLEPSAQLRDSMPEKSALSGMTVLGQLDRKVILAKTQGGGLYAFDQHAVHERIRFETLLSLAQRFSSDILGSTLIDPFKIDLTSFTRYYLLKEFEKSLADWKWQFRLFPEGTDSEQRLASGTPCSLEITSIPVVCGVSMAPEDILVQLDEMESLGAHTGFVPRQVLHILKSKACRGAVMFGDALSIETSQVLLQKLANCQHPFWCAHGRPNVACLLDL